MGRFFLTDFTDTESSTTRKFGEPRNICGNAVLPTSITKLLFIPANDVTFCKDSFPRERRAWKLCLRILRSRVNIAEKIKCRNVSSLWTICLSEQEIIWLSASLQPRFLKVSNPSGFRLFKRHNPISYALYRVMYPIADTCFFLKLEITGLVRRSCFLLFHAAFLNTDLRFIHPIVRIRSYANNVTDRVDLFCGSIDKRGRTTMKLMYC